MSPSFREVNDIAIIDVLHDLDFNDAIQVKDLVESFIRNKQYKVLVNLNSAPLITSRGMGTLITSQVKLKKYGGDLKIFGVRGQNQEVFEVTKLNTIFDIYDEEEDAVLAFSKK